MERPAITHPAALLTCLTWYAAVLVAFVVGVGILWSLTAALLILAGIFAASFAFVLAVIIWEERS